ncbi:trafficking kinesin-binding protein 1-like isoform X2 [Paramacrobiotus metropolitanus]|uniref:trafficking kinesin-binding protein 1-like isoform X2 n=1 Tax=Paramacrobiotus metropolitanus TaxID=2943436 RepID=UPI0024465151|nr:trafficking kinesin-binding protein 1-like isoform X2 [Paramacrobiotus metropolitanus]
MCLDAGLLDLYTFIDARRPPLPMAEAPPDVDSLQRLIVEKEKDLELAARIGQSLLSKNNVLQHNHDELVRLYSLTQDELTQLRHELAMNKELLRICLDEVPDYDDGDGVESDDATVRKFHALQRTIRVLEDENHRLRLEAKELSAEAAEFDTKETEIIHDCVKELADSNEKIQSLQFCLKKKTEENATLQDEVTALLNEMVELQTRIKKAFAENDQLKTTLEAFRENQNQLACELIQMQDKYDRLCSYTHDLEDELKDLRKRDNHVQTWSEMSSSISAMDSSLAAELNLSLHHIFNSVGCHENEEEEDCTDHLKKLMEVMRLANAQRPIQNSCTTVNATSACVTSVASSPRKAKLLTSANNSSVLGPSRGSYFQSVASDSQSVIPLEPSFNDDSLCDKSLSGRSSISLFDARRCATPDSAMSLGAGSDSSFSSAHRSHPTHHDLSPNLLLVKRMEGSHNLAKWKSLATSSLDGFLESRHGILTKGQNQESDKIMGKPGVRREAKNDGMSVVARNFRSTPTTNTFTNSRSSSVSGDSIFGLSGVLKNDKVGLTRPVFPRPSEPVPTAAMELTKILNVPTLSSDDEVAEATRDESDGKVRSRRSSGSLSSVSRTPSPPMDLTTVPAASVNVFDKLYHRSPLLSLSTSMDRLANIKPRKSMSPDG